ACRRRRRGDGREGFRQEGIRQEGQGGRQARQRPTRRDAERVRLLRQGQRLRLHQQEGEVRVPGRMRARGLRREAQQGSREGIQRRGQASAGRGEEARRCRAQEEGGRGR